MSSKNVLVTGATGFIGNRLSESLLQADRQVHLVVRPSSDRSRLDELPGVPEVHEHGGTTEDLVDIVQKIEPQTVFHLASHFLASHSPADVEPLIRSNLLFGAQLLEATVRAEVPFFINTGTSWQHYQQEEYNPVCLYAATKQGFEALIRYYTETSDLKVITLKLSDTYGPRDPRKKLFRLLKETSQSGKRLAMSEGEQKLDLVFVDDVVRAFERAEELLQEGSTDSYREYSVQARELLSLREIVSIFERETNRRLQIDWGARAYRSREVFHPWRGATLPGWKAEVSLAEGIQRLETEASLQ